MLNAPVDAAIDQLTGPIYARALIAGAPSDAPRVDSIVTTLVQQDGAA